MIALAAGPRITWVESPLYAGGIVLLLIYAANLVRGRDLLPRGPAPEARFKVTDALGVLLAAVALQVLLGGAAADLGIEWVVLRLALAYLGPVAVAAGAFAFFVRRREEHGPRGRAALAGLASWLAVFPVVAGVLIAWAAVLRAAGFEWTEQGVLTRLRGNLPVFFVTAVVLAPFAEEVLFRGMLYAALRRSLGILPSAAISAAAFAFVHLDLHVAPAIFLLGLALAWVYERTGSLWGPFVFHAVFNGWTFLGVVAEKVLGGG